MPAKKASASTAAGSGAKKAASAAAAKKPKPSSADSPKAKPKPKDDSKQVSDAVGTVKLKYNNYNESLPITGGVLKWEVVDEEYAISFVFQGDFRRRVVGPDGREAATCAAGFAGLQDGVQYELLVDEDEEAGVGNAEITRKFVVSEKGAAMPGGSRAVAQLTAELKGLSANDLRAQTEEYRQLKEARDLEDVLYSA